jgi:alpha-tubulin suppressor-like RCC1 family protein
MKTIYPWIWLLLGCVITAFSKPVPYTGKISLDGINYDGQANFQFTIFTEDGKAVWRNGKDTKSTISVSVRQGRYSVLLGGQGMNPISPELFLEHKNLFLSVYVDLNDGKGLRHLPPDQPIYSVPHALSADLAERAKVADRVVAGSISKQMLGADVLADLNRTISKSLLGQDVKNQLYAPVSASRLDPVMKNYLAPLLEPKATSMLSDKDRLEGKSTTLRAPNATGQNLVYQWYKNNQPIVGATTGDLVLASLRSSDDANYTIHVSNDFGSFTQDFSLNVLTLGKMRIAAGSNHFAFIDGKGSVWTTGYNNMGQLGTGDREKRDQTHEVYVGNVKKIRANGSSTFFLTQENKLYGMGDTRLLGIGWKTIPTLISDEELIDFECRGSMFIVKKDGSLWGWGNNQRGQLGLGTSGNTHNQPQKIIESGVVRVEVGWDHTVFLKDDGSLWAMGGNKVGGQNNRLGINSSNWAETTPQLVVPSGVVDLSVGGAHTLFVKVDGSAWGFGSNHQKNSRLGAGGDKVLPVKIIDSGVVKVSAGDYHSLFLLEDGSVLGMGRNLEGQLGGTDTSDQQTPKVMVASGAVDISSGSFFSTITLNDAKIIGFGLNLHGQLSAGASLNFSVPQKVPNLKVTDVATNTNGSYFVDVNGSLWSVGKGDAGDSGNGLNTYFSNPVKIVDGNVSSVESINTTVLYRDHNGSLLGFGEGDHGRLGNNSNSDRFSPIMIQDGNITSFASGNSYSAMVLEDGSLWTFGHNSYGQLGDGNNTHQRVPVKIVDANVTQVAAGNHHTLYLKKNGSVWSMGRNNAGQLGDGTQTDRNSPFRVIEENATAVACGHYHSFIIMNNGSLLAFGSNGNFRSGLPVGTNYLTPQIVFSEGIKSVSGGFEHSLFLKADGSLWASGYNLYCRVGVSELGHSIKLTKIVDSGVAGISAGNLHSIYWTVNGEVYAFGSDGSGQLGLGRKVRMTSPHVVYDPSQ